MEHKQVSRNNVPAHDKKIHSVSKPGITAMAEFDPMMQFQQALGNQAMLRLLQSGAVQAKLKIGKPNDKYEQEADRVAEQVMRTSDSGIQRKPN